MHELATHERFDKIASDCIGQLAAQLGRRYSRTATALDAFTVYDNTGRQGEAVTCIRGFLGAMEQVLHEGRGLVLFGNAGTGKDHLLAAALYYVAGAGIPVAFTSGQRLFAGIRDTMDSGDREEKIVGPLVAPIVIGISDPLSPRGDLSDWDARILADLIDRRYRAQRATWITLNATDEADGKNKLTALIWDRLRDGSEVVPCFWPSFRGLRGKPSASQPIAGKISAAS